MVAISGGGGGGGGGGLGGSIVWYVKCPVNTKHFSICQMLTPRSWNMY